MPRRPLLAIVVFVLALLTATAAPAATSKDEKNLDKETARLERTAATAEGEKAVIKRINSDFKVDAARVAALRSRNLGYGEIVTACSLARSLAGGCTEPNLEKVLSLRQGPPRRGWSEVARQLDVKLGPTVSQVKKLNDESHREIKKDHAAAGPQAGGAHQK